MGRWPRTRLRRIRRDQLGLEGNPPLFVDLAQRQAPSRGIFSMSGRSFFLSRKHAFGPAYRSGPIHQGNLQDIGHIFGGQPTELALQGLRNFVQVFFVTIRNNDGLDTGAESGEYSVKVDGRLNDPTTTDRGWTVEIALPWKSLAFLFDGRTLPPGEGETLRCDFSRFEALRVHGKAVPENPGWSLNPHGAYDSHIPESFSVVRFTKRPPGP